MKRLLIPLLTLAALAWAGIPPAGTFGRVYITGDRATGTPDPVLDRSHYPYYGYLNLFGTDTAAGSFRVFNRNASGSGLMVRLVSGTNDTTRIDSTGIYTTGSVTSGGPMVNSDSAFHKGYTTLGDSVIDRISLFGQLLTHNRAGSTDWTVIKNPAALVRGSQVHFAATLTGMGGSTQFNELFVNAQMETAHASASIRGAEIKGTTKANLSGTSQLIGAYLKTTTKNSATTAWTTPCYSILDIESGSTVTKGCNFFAEHANNGTSEATILSCKANTWRYGVDFDDATFTASDIRLSNGGLISDARETYLTIIQDTISLYGGVEFNNTTAIVKGMIPSLSGDLDSLGVIVTVAAATDTFWIVTH